MTLPDHLAPPAPPAGLPASERAASLYRRPLPDGQIAFSSTEGRRLFREALAAGHMEGWFALSEQFHTQAEPAFCGLGTLVVVLNALEIDPGRVWKGPWRWYGEELLDCCQPLERVREHGVTLDELGCLARCNGTTATLVRAAPGEPRSTVEALRDAIRVTTAAARGPVLVAGYTRSALGQTGSGHFSPVGGYHPARDLALILDVARFKYPPHWVAVSELWQAMTEVDPATGNPRGWLILDRGRRPMPQFCRLSASGGVSALSAFLLDDIPALLSGLDTSSLEALVTGWVRALDGRIDGRMGDHVREALKLVALPAPDELPLENRGMAEAFLFQLRATRVYQAVRRARIDTSSPSLSNEILAILLLALPPEMVCRLPAPLAAMLDVLRAPADIGPAVSDEIEALRDQLTTLREWSCGRPSAASPSST